jgi:hypothetical protein
MVEEVKSVLEASEEGDCYKLRPVGAGFAR